MANEVLDLTRFSPKELAALSTQATNLRLEKLEDDVKYLKDEQPVHPNILQKLEKQRKKVVIDFLGGKGTKAYKELSRVVFSEAGRDFKENFGIPKYDLLAKKDSDSAFEYWEEWEPCTNTKMKIKQLNNQMELIEKE